MTDTNDTDKGLGIRIPGELRGWVEAKARAEGRTPTNWVIWQLQKIKEQDEKEQT